MATVYRGIQQRIRKRSTPWPDRLKLLKFSWITENVLIPNKHQVLIDWLCMCLSNQKKQEVPPDTAQALWKCLHDVLGTKQVHNQTSSQSIILKPTICVAMIQSLSASAADQSWENVNDVIGCCLRIVTSENLGHMITSKLELMVSLLGCLTHLCASQLSHNKQPSGETVKLLSTVADRCNVLHRQDKNPKKLMGHVVDKLLPPCMTLCYLLKESGSSDLSSVRDKILYLLNQSLFNKEVQESYTAFLSPDSGSAEAKAWVANTKSVEKVFNDLSEGLKVKHKKDTLKWKSALCSLPIFYRGFLAASRIDGYVRYQLFIHLCSLLGFKEQPLTLNSQLEEEEAVLGTLRELLLLVAEYEVYSVAGDRIAGGQQLKWLQGLTAALLNLKTRCISWYQCLSCLLVLDHGILETHMEAVISHCWLHTTQLSKEVLSAQDELLTGLIQTYNKLRQPQKLLKILLAAIRGQHLGHEHTRLPVGAAASFSECVQNLPQGQAIEIWKIFLKECQEHYMPESAIASESALNLDCVLSLLALFLLNVRFVDQAVTPATCSQVAALMEDTESKVLKGLLTASLMGNSKLSVLSAAALNLCLTWGELYIVLAHYTKSASGRAVDPPLTASHHYDLTFIHPTLQASEWKQVADTVLKSHDYRCKILLHSLGVQKAKALLLLSPDLSPAVITSVQNVLVDLWRPFQNQDSSTAGHWNGKMEGVNQSNFPAAHLKLVTESLPNIVRQCSDEQLAQLADVVVKALAQKQDSSDREVCTMHMVAKEVITSKIIWELQPIQTAVVKTVWKEIADNFTHKKQSPKKKRKSTGIVGTIWQQFVETGSLMDTDQGVWESLGRQVTDHLAENQSRSNYSPETISKVMMNLKVIGMLPLEYLLPSNQMFCLVGTTLLLAGAKPDHTSLDQIQLVESCLNQMAVVMEGVRNVQFFRVTNCGKYLTWLMGIVSQHLQKQEEGKQEGLLERYSLVLRSFLQMTLLNGPILREMDGFIGEVVSLHSEGTCQLVTLQTTATLLQQLSKILNRAHCKAEIRSAAKVYMDSVSASFLHHLELQMLKMQSPPASASLANYLYAYIAILQYHASPSNSKENKTLKEGAGGDEVSTPKEGGDGEDGNTPKEGEDGEAENTLKEGGDGNTKNTPKESGDGEAENTPKVDGDEEVMDTLEKEGSAEKVVKPTLKEGTEQQVKCVSLLKTMCELSLRTSESQRNITLPKLKFIQATCVHYEKIRDVVERTFFHESWQSIVQLVKSITETNKKGGPDGSTPPSAREASGTMDCEGKHENASAEKSVDGSGDGSPLLSVGDGDDVSQALNVTLLALVRFFSVDEFSRLLQNLLSNMSVSNLEQHPVRIATAVSVWQHLLVTDMEQEKQVMVGYAAQNVLMSIQTIVQNISGSSSGCADHIQDLIVPLMATQTVMLSMGPELLSPQSVSLCLHSCSLLPLEGLPFEDFVSSSNALYEVLNAMLVSHTETVFNITPTFVSASRRLLAAIIHRGRQRAEEMSAEKVAKIVACAHLVERLFTLLSEYKAEFNKVAPYLVADYVTEAQKVTLLPSVKKTLLPGVYKLLDICDRYSISLLHVVLAPGVKEVFKLLYNEYTKYHKYTGRV